ncbi:Uncharacterized protein family (UPF0160) [Popillia japonica]|uniref:Uncharacterized protein family (UPF0160) n=1 Tax=Popillia japonica TaxID=7064 RepID=A0AAW1KMM7_POPJA
MNSATSPANLFKIPLKAAELVWNGFTTMVSENKIPRILKRIGTHSGVFHCDEALACFMLKQLPDYEDAEIIRTRNSDILNTCDIVVDVGGDYDVERNRFDHHQRGFEHTFSTILPNIASNKTIKLSSAGLIYVHYGMEIISAVLKKMNHTPTTECLKGLFLAVYEGFVEELDAIDNGIPMYADGHPKYRINTHLSARVHRLNPEWNTKNPEPADELFKKAMDLVGNEFTEKVVETATVWWPARDIVKSAILNRKTFYPSGEIIKLEERCPWKDHLLSLEEELGVNGEIKFVIFHDPSDSWRIQGIPVQPDSFICRVFLHKNWRGERDEQLQQISGVEGAIFCHSTGFIGGNKTMEGSLKMAIKSLEAAVIDRD